MSLQQLALSVLDLPTSCRWYEDVLGLLPAGGGDLSGPLLPEAMAIPNQSIKYRWMIDGQSGFQLELIKQERPAIRLRPRDWRLNDIGYAMAGYYVGDFDKTIHKARLLGSAPLTDPIGDRGQRRVCLRDPDGILIELLEEDVRSQRPRSREPETSASVLRFVTISVESLEHALVFYRDGMGFELGEPVHETKHEALWGLDNAVRKSAVLWLDDVMLELVEYVSPRGKPRPADYRLTDQGILNVALVFSNRVTFNAAMRLMRANGATATREPAYSSDDWGAIYFNDPQNISMELSYVAPHARAVFGFAPKPYGVVIEHLVSIKASKALIWEKITNPSYLQDWLPQYFVRVIEDGTDEPHGLNSKREIFTHREAHLETVVGWQPKHLVDVRRPDTGELYDYFCRTNLRENDDGHVEVKQRLSFMCHSPTNFEIDRTIEVNRQSALTAQFSKSMENALTSLKILCEDIFAAETDRPRSF